MSRRIGIDIGGTFTDIATLERDGSFWVWKEESNPADPAQAIRAGLSAMADRLCLSSTDKLLEDCELLVHGSTIATNTIIERSGAKVGLICTKGFRDSLYLRDGFRPDRFNRTLQRPREFADRYLRLGVRERIDRHGEVLQQLVEKDVFDVVSTFREAEVEGVAVALLWSIVNNKHEQRIREIVAAEMPSVPVLLSSDVLPEIREWERTSATVLGAYVQPRLGRYLREFEEFVRGTGLPRRPLIMQINGGCASVDRVLERPVVVIHSGPAAAPASARHFGAESGARDFISIDMGGTSFDVCLIRDGTPVSSRTLMVEDTPIGISGVEVHSVGAGGGSIAWVDHGGALRVGPQSAGAVPGPACYGKGGSLPTVTDANLVLGYLAEDTFLGGRRVLHHQLAEQALETHVAEPLGLDVDEAAAGVYRIVNANMVNAIRTVSVQRGIDPRGFVLVCGGGAGGIHVADLAAQLEVSEVIVPNQAGLYCAFGMTVTDVRHDLSRHIEANTAQLRPQDVEAIFGDMEATARQMLSDDGFTADRMQLVRTIDARYPNQVHELAVEVPGNLSDESIESIEARFHAQHERLFTYAMRELPVQILHWRVAAIGRSPGARDAWASPMTKYVPEPAMHRRIYLSATRSFEEVGVFAGEALEPGAIVTGPAVVTSESTTIVVPAEERLVAGWTSFRLVHEDTGFQCKQS